jgi:hypothetical protein
LDFSLFDSLEDYTTITAKEMKAAFIVIDKAVDETSKKIKDLGKLVKIDTNGYGPGQLKKCIDSGNVDFR